jgi:hypothetical protein
MLLIIGAFFVLLVSMYNLVWHGTRLFRSAAAQAREARPD